MEEVKFTEDEMLKLKKLQDDFNSIVLQLGQLDIEEINLEIAKNRLAEAKAQLKQNYVSVLDGEKTLSAELNAKYGAGVLDPRTGIFKPTVNASQ